jgi:hypothetical protein
MEPFDATDETLESVILEDVVDGVAQVDVQAAEACDVCFARFYCDGTAEFSDPVNDGDCRGREGSSDTVCCAEECVVSSGGGVGLSGGVCKAPPEVAGCLAAEVSLVGVPGLRTVPGHFVLVFLFIEREACDSFGAKLAIVSHSCLLSASARTLVAEGIQYGMISMSHRAACNSRVQRGAIALPRTVCLKSPLTTFVLSLAI